MRLAVLSLVNCKHEHTVNYIIEQTKCTFSVLFLTVTSTCFEQASYSSSVGDPICSVLYVRIMHSYRLAAMMVKMELVYGYIVV